VDDAREHLFQERQRVRRRLRDLTEDFDSIVDASRDSNDDDEHDPEGATIAFERSQVIALARQAAHHLEEIDAALARIEEGVYGWCERCESRIDQGRLDARPTARTCIRCATTGVR
jgi:RNA polymerase-binding protein DksA